MAEENAAPGAVPATPENVFTPVSIRPRHRGSSLRNPSGCTLAPTGTSGLNLAGASDLDDLAAAARLDPNAYSVRYGVNEAAGTIAIYTVSPDASDSKMVRRKKNGEMTIYLADVFDQFPPLRPVSKRTCSVSLATDNQGGRCLVINVNASLQRLKRQHAKANAAKTEPTSTETK